MRQTLTVATDRNNAADESHALKHRVDELSALYRLTDRLHRARSLADVFEGALDAITETLGCQRASILLFDSANVMRFVAWRGLSESYRRAVEGHSPWKPGALDPQPIFVADIEQTNEPDWIKTTVRNEGVRGLGFIPLAAQRAVIGKFMTYYDAVHEFSEHDIELAVTIGRQVGFGLERFSAEEARRLAEDELRESEERFRLMSEHAPVMIWMSDVRGNCLHLNRMLRDFWGVAEEAVADFKWHDMLHTEDAGHVQQALTASIATRSGFTTKARFRCANGEYRVLQTDARARLSAKGEFLGLIGVNVDITEREAAEKALGASEEQFRLAVEAAPAGMLMTDVEGRIVMLNAQAERLFGYSRDELIDEKIEILVPGRFQPAHPGFRSAYYADPSARPMGAGRELFAVRKDGTELPVEIGLSPIETSDGTMTLAAIVDITGRKRAEAERELLLEELNHRVKNTLAVVQGIAYQTFKDTDAGDARDAFEGRLIALAVGHNLLTQSSWESASLTQLIKATLQISGSRGERISLSGPEVLLPPKAALGIAMALHELHTNAIKHGALGNDAGRIALAWSRMAGPDGALRIEWHEMDGPPVSHPARRGFGSLLLERTLAQDLRGKVTMDFRPEGLVCSIEVPLPEAKDIAGNHADRQADPPGGG